MCVVSMIADDWQRDILPTHPWATPNHYPNALPPSRAEFDALRAELERLKKELLAGKAQDAANGEPDCEMEDKIAILRELASMLDVDFTGVFKDAG